MSKKSDEKSHSDEPQDQENTSVKKETGEQSIKNNELSKEEDNPEKEKSVKSKSGVSKTKKSKYSKEDGAFSQKEDSIIVKKEPPVFSLFDFIFPGGKLAKLCKVHEEEKVLPRIPEIFKAFKIKEAVPSIILCGARDSNRDKLLAGVSRTAFRSDAIIIDSGVKTGIENYCLRRNVKLFGVFPETQVVMPKINPTERAPNELSNGHSHLFMKCGENLSWGSEANLKYELAKNLSLGPIAHREYRNPPCKIVYVVMGEGEIGEWIDDVRIAVEQNLPIILVKGSDICDKMISFINEKTEFYNKEMEELLQKGHFYALESNKSEDIAGFTHFFLCVTPY